jgi:hypothetical protein
MEVASTSKTSVNVYQTTQRYNPEEGIFVQPIFRNKTNFEVISKNTIKKVIAFGS